MQDISENRGPAASHGTDASPGAIPQPAIAPIDALQRTIVTTGARVVALAPPHQDVATPAITRMLGHALATSGVATLIIDASGELTDAPGPNTWVPGDAIRDGLIEVAAKPRANDRFTLPATPSTRALFNNPERLEKTLRGDLAHYGVIILELPAVLDIGEHHLNAVSLARAADAAYLVCTAEQTTNLEVQNARDALASAGVKLAGVVLDNSAASPPGPEMAAFVEKYLPLPGFLRRRLAGFLRRSEYFNEVA